MHYPFDDDYMYYDFHKHRYVLTLKDVEENLDIDLVARLRRETQADKILRQVSSHVYNYIHSTNSVFASAKDFVIAKTLSGRAIIQEAMEEQLIYMLMNGDLHRSTDKEKRALAMDDEAIDILSQLIPEIGCNLLYGGRIYINPRLFDKGEW